MKNRRKKLLQLSIIFLFLLPVVARAADYPLSAPLPGMPKTLPNDFNPAGYIQYFFSFGLYLAAFLAVGFIAVGGIMWIVAAGNPSRIDKAKEMIIGAISGLVLLLCSYLILNTIDPSLTNIAAPTLEKYDIEAPPPHEGLGYSLTDAQVTSSAIAKGVYQDPINKAAQKYGLPPTLIQAVILTESSGNANALGPSTKNGDRAQGLMQLMPKTATNLGVTDPFDPAQNIDGGAKYLSQLYKQYNGNLDNTLAAYNYGMGNLQKICGGNAVGCSQLPSETQNYINKVKRIQSDLI